MATGSLKIYEELKKLCEDDPDVEVELQEHVEHVGIVKSGCQGFCELGPLVRIEPYSYQYIKVQMEDCKEIADRTVKLGEPVERLFYEKNNKSYAHPKDIPYFKNISASYSKTAVISMQSHYLNSHRRIFALTKALFEMSPEAALLMKWINPDFADVEAVASWLDVNGNR